MSRRAWASVMLAAVSALGCTSAPAPPVVGSTSTPAGPTLPGESPGAGSTSSPQVVGFATKPACDLVFKDEASAALGVPIESADSFDATDQDGQGSVSDCLYRRTSFGDVAPLELTLAVGQSHLDQFEQMKTDEGASSLAGVGDEAVLRISDVWGLDGPIGALFAKVGNAVVGLTLGIADISDDGSLVLVGDADQQRRVLTDLAGLAIGRLTAPVPAEAKVCDLVTLEQASTMLGLALSAAEDLDNHDAWGPACQYKGSDGRPELFVSVNSRPTGQQNFDSCKANGETAVGVGEDAFFDISGCPIVVAFQYVGNPLMVRSGDTVLAVGEAGKLEHDQSHEVIKAVARLVLEKLGLDAGSPPRPPAADALVHPCALLSEAEVGSAVGVGIATHAEWSAQSNQDALCYYSIADANVSPLHLRLGTGQGVVREFGDYRRFGGYTAVDGIGDEALQFQSQADSDQPLVSIYVRSGETVLEVYLGGNGYSADTGKLIAAGTPAEQLEILRGLAELILPRIFPPD